MRADARSFIALSIGCLLVGCQPAPERVYVDLDSVTERPFLALEAVPPAEWSPVLAQMLEIQGLPESEIQVESAEELAKRGLEALELSQERALQDTLERLRRAYLLEVRRFESERRQEIMARQEILLNEAYDELYARFLAMAQETGPRYWELSWLSGFPDPDPQSRRRPISARAFEVAYFERARQLREEIEALHLEHRSGIVDVLDRLDSDLIAELAQVEAEVEAIRRDRELQARIDAEEIARATLEEIQATTIELRRTLPAIPAVAVRIEGSERLPALPSMAPDRRTESHKSMMEQQLEVFARVQGYELVQRPQAGRDATEEFIQWREKFQVTR